MFNLGIHPDTFVAVRYFTKRAAGERLVATAKARHLSLEKISEAHRYFNGKKIEEAVTYAAEVNKMVKATGVTAVDCFTNKWMEEKGGRRVAMVEKVEAPVFMAVRFFLYRPNA